MQIRFWKYLKIFWESVSEVHPKSLKLDHWTKTHMCHLCYLMFIWCLFAIAPVCVELYTPDAAGKISIQVDGVQLHGEHLSESSDEEALRLGIVGQRWSDASDGPSQKAPTVCPQEGQKYETWSNRAANESTKSFLVHSAICPMVFRHVSLGNQWVGMVWLCGMKPPFGSSTSDKCWPSFPSIDQ